jgi:hypothetical protein
VLAQKVYQLMIKAKEKAESSTLAFVAWWLTVGITLGIAISATILLS